MPANKIFDFVLRKEPWVNKKPPYVLKGYVVLKQPTEVPGFNRAYVGLTEDLKTAEEADKAISLILKDIYALKKKMADEFRAVATAQKKLDDAAAEAEKQAAKKAAEKEKKENEAKAEKERKKREKG